MRIGGGKCSLVTGHRNWPELIGTRSLDIHSMTGINSICASPSEHPKPASFKPPVNACDCHAHVFNSDSELVANRSYTPPAAPLPSYQRMLKTVGTTRSVIVQPSVYGTDNRATLNAVAAGGSNYRTVVVDYDSAGEFQVNAAGVARTARKLADGKIYVPSEVWEAR